MELQVHDGIGVWCEICGTGRRVRGGVVKVDELLQMLLAFVFKERGREDLPLESLIDASACHPSIP